MANGDAPLPPTFIPEDQVDPPQAASAPATAGPPPPAPGAPSATGFSVEEHAPKWNDPPPAPTFIPEDSLPAGATGGSALPQAQPKWSGSMLPVSIGQDSKARLDWNAGLPGAIKSAATLPGDIATGKTTLADPATQQRAIAAGSLPAVDAGGLTSVLRTPEQGELAAAAKGGYDTAANLGVNYTTGGIHSIGDTIKQSWKNGGVTPSNSKGNWDQLNAMLTQHTDTGVFPIQSLEQQRQAFNGLLMSKEPKDRQGARLAIDAIDDFYENPGKFVDSGPADQAGQILKTARANAAAGYRADRFGNQAAAAEAAGEAPTGDYTKSFQSRMRWMSDPRYPARLAGFSDDEKAAIGAAAKPSASQKVVSIANSMLGEKGMLGLALEHAAGPIGLAAGWIGAPMVKGALEAAANRATSGSFQNIDRMIRQRSPLYTSGAQGVEPKFTTPVRQVLGRQQAPAAFQDIIGSQHGTPDPNYKPTSKGLGALPSVSPSPYRPPATGGVATPLPTLYD